MGSELIERRPGSNGSLATNFPREWGKQPEDAEERMDWIKTNLLDGVERRTKGETVAWLADRPCAG